MSNKRLYIIVISLIMALALAGCLPLPGSKTRSTASNDIDTTDAQTKAYMNLAAALLLENEYTMALQELEKAKAKDARNVDLENYFGLTYYGMKEYELSVQSYQKALEMRPERTDVRNNLGMAYLAQKQYDKALAEFNTSANDLAYQKKYLPMTNIGLTYLEMGRYDEALASLLKVTEVAPSYAKAYQLIGRVYMSQGSPREAVDYLNNAAKLNPDDTETHMSLGEAFSSLGRAQEAAEAYSRVARLAPNTPMALEAQKRARRIMGFE